MANVGTALGSIVDAMQVMHEAVSGVTLAPAQSDYRLRLSRKQLPYIWTHITDVDPDMDHSNLADLTIHVICLVWPIAEAASWTMRLSLADTILGRLVKLWNDDNTKAAGTIKAWRNIKGVGGHMVNWHGTEYYAVGVELGARVYL